MPDKNTIWGFKEGLNEDGGIEKLFVCFERQLKAAGLVGSEGKIIDASFVDVPRQRNSREETEKHRNEANHRGSGIVELGVQPGSL